MTQVSRAVSTAKGMLEEVRLYWRTPRPGEYVPYREVVTLSIGWMALCLSTQWVMNFGVGNEFAGMTLHMNNNQLLIMSYVCQGIGYVLTPLNAWIVDNLRSKDGKYRVYMKLAIPLMFLAIISLWLPYEQVRDARQPYTQYVMIGMYFIAMQVHNYVRSWVWTGVENMVHVITPNSQERTRLMSITGILYSLGYTITNLYFPIMVSLLTVNDNKYTMTYWRGAYTPLMVFIPVILVAYFGTKERLILPKSRETHMSFSNSLRSVADNKIFWIRCIDSWNDFLEGAKGDVWNWMVYRAHIMKSSTYGVLNTLCHNAQFWAMLVSPWLIKRFGKRNIKIWKNIIQVLVIVGIKATYRSKLSGVFLFLFTFIDRFVDCGVVIDTSIEADMRDNQQYLTGERIDGAFGVIRTYMGGVIGSFTGLFIPWLYKKEGFDGNDYSVLDLYSDYDETKPLSAQIQNPRSVLFDLMDVLLLVSICGAVIDVIPWFWYDITEIGQRSMIRVIRLRTIVEDRHMDISERDNDAYIEGCEAVYRAREYYGKEKVEIPTKAEMKAARAMPNGTEEEKQARLEAIHKARKDGNDARDYNDEIDMASFVMHELNRFETEFGQKQLALASFIVEGGESGFYERYEQAYKMALELPKTDVNEERKWRKQDIRNARNLKKSAELVLKYYPDGRVFYNDEDLEAAFNMPDDTKAQVKARRKAIRAENKKKNIYARVAGPYLNAKRTLDLCEGYRNIDDLLTGYDDAVIQRTNEHAAAEAEAQRLAEERAVDAERKAAERKMKKDNRAKK